jgi:hypothetical protein
MKTSSFKTFFAFGIVFTGLAFSTMASNEKTTPVRMTGIQPHDLIAPPKPPKTTLTTAKFSTAKPTSARARIFQNGLIAADIPFEGTESLINAIKRSPKFKKGTLTAAVIDQNGNMLQHFKISKK